MSECKKFNATNVMDQSPEERLALLEAKLPVLIERIQTYDRIVDQCQSLKEELVNAKAKLLYTESVLNEYKQTKRNLEFYIDEISKKLNSTIESNHNQNSFLFKSQSEMKENIQEIQVSNENSINKLESYLNRSLDSKVNKYSFEEFEKRYVKDIDLLKNLSSECAVRLVDLMDKVEFVKRDNLSLIENNRVISGDVFNCCEIIKSLQKDLIDLNENIDNRIDKCLVRFMAKIDKKMEDLSLKLVPQGISLEEIKTDFSTRLYDFKIDVSNSVIKTDNNSKHISMIEKKLENVYLLIKKYELTQ